MQVTMSSTARQKEVAAIAACDLVESGMVLGLGTGSTVEYFLDELSRRIAAGAIEDVCGVPTSEATVRRATEVGIPLTNLHRSPRLDLAVDGADEIDANLDLIKGLGRALLREKLVETHADLFVVIADESKQVELLGRGPLPVELVDFEIEANLRWLASLGCEVEHWLETDGSPARTDNGNQLAKLHFDAGISDPHALARELEARPGIVEHGLFLDMATGALIGGESGLEAITRPGG